MAESYKGYIPRDSLPFDSPLSSLDHSHSLDFFPFLIKLSLFQSLIVCPCCNLWPVISEPLIPFKDMLFQTWAFSLFLRFQFLNLKTLIFFNSSPLPLSSFGYFSACLAYCFSSPTLVKLSSCFPWDPFLDSLTTHKTGNCTRWWLYILTVTMYIKMYCIP